MKINRPKVDLNYSWPDAAKYLNSYLGEIARELNALIDSHRLSNYTATTNPAITDDITKGYKVGSTWLNTSTGKWYFCAVETAGAASWSLVN